MFSEQIKEILMMKMKMLQGIICVKRLSKLTRKQEVQKPQLMRKQKSHKSIAPTLRLHDMVEIKHDLTLTQLKAVLKGHFKKESSIDIYYRLVNIIQDSRGSPQNFLSKAIELKERLLPASGEVGSDEQYSAEFIQRKFLWSVSTG